MASGDKVPLMCGFCGFKIRSIKTAKLDPKTHKFYHNECDKARKSVKK
jgi:hypothetical protein